ncbi:MAG: DUF3078 domain-containing protein [Bacteroidota bacterium]|nr:DUF3078 domain-containing protein [Bacteroidota bacterium]
MKRFLLFIFSLTSILAYAQPAITDTLKVETVTLPKRWTKGGSFGFNFTQTTYNNWAAGGENSISGQALLGLYVNYKKDSTTWENYADFAFGLVQQGKGYVRKTDDKIDFTSKYSKYAFDKVWYYSALFGFKTQFIPGYTFEGDTARTLISDFMAPGYAILAIGLDYRPNKKFSLFMAPLTGKITFVMNQQLADAGAFGVEAAERDTAGNVLTPGKNIRYEFGGYVRAQYQAEIMTNVTLKARLELFSNYLDRPGNIDINAETLLTMKVNKYISASLASQVIYDNDINISVDKNRDGVYESAGPRLQFRQVLGVGFAVKF